MNINYALFYTHEKDNIDEKTNLKHVFISIAKFNEDTEEGEKVNLEHRVIIDNNNLSWKVEVKANGKDVSPHLELLEQITDDLLWSIVAQFKHKLQHDKNYPITLLKSKGEDAILKTYVSLMNPTNDTEIKDNPLKTFLTKFGQAGSGAGLMGLFQTLGKYDKRLKVIFYSMGIIGRFIPTTLVSKQV